uniref:Uncharacterized protein n=1 Tax=Arundo donax TaxID=35708 RepID=A0A0A9C420_ARUDO
MGHRFCRGNGSGGGRRISDRRKGSGRRSILCLF